ncbi:MAG: DNA polymerase III subunit gamma and tau [Cryobacterium sp.]|nr:DNA polymerase III subunit gamma and tau [Cryobacterium sp.]
MVTALYRRYRPETFAELIGQSQVTEPLQTALRTNRVNHAYLFSGPRGCGKTTSARILARCLNCAEGPTDTPCGKCSSCIELARDGGGSLDVVEIDAASHNGVDDARDLRERAVFAPARDRYKIFILDEAHMVTPQGFNALLKIVEEPPEHVKFIFATTEPEKVIGTIRSRTHHYPFRLVPPAQLLEYVEQLIGEENYTAEPGVLPLVVRAGGGSVRDTLSLLDQLIAGSEGTVLAYERAVALLGYTHSSLLGEVIDALGARDAAAAFGAVDRVIQTGQDPRRFVEDLLERLRDLIIVAATGAGAGAVLRGIPQDELESMTVQAARFGTAELSRTADVVGAALTELTGATSPRLHLELMIARVLVPESDDTERGTLARVERLERRVGVVGVDGASEPAVAAERPSEPVRTAPPAAPETPAPSSTTAPIDEAAPAPSSAPTPSTTPVTSEQLINAWPQVLEAVARVKRTAWTVVVTARPMGYKDDVLALAFPSENDANSFRELKAPGDSVSEILRSAIQEVLGVRVKFLARVDAAARRPAANAEQAPPPQDEPPADAEPDPVDDEPQDLPRFTTSTSWAVAEIPGAEPAASTPPAEPQPAAAPAKPTTPAAPAERQRYGEAVVREVLRASFIEEEELAPRVTPTEA